MNKESVYKLFDYSKEESFFVKSSDGTEIWLNSETKLRSIRLLSWKVLTREVELIYGEALFKVSPSIAHKRRLPFNVLQKSQEIDVLGTEFNVKA